MIFMCRVPRPVQSTSWLDRKQEWCSSLHKITYRSNGRMEKRFTSEARKLEYVVVGITYSNVCTPTSMLLLFERMWNSHTQDSRHTFISSAFEGSQEPPIIETQQVNEVPRHLNVRKVTTYDCSLAGAHKTSKSSRDNFCFCDNERSTNWPSCQLHHQSHQP